MIVSSVTAPLTAMVGLKRCPMKHRSKSSHKSSIGHNENLHPAYHNALNLVPLTHSRALELIPSLPQFLKIHRRKLLAHK